MGFNSEFKGLMNYNMNFLKGIKNPTATTVANRTICSTASARFGQ